MKLGPRNNVEHFLDVPLKPIERRNVSYTFCVESLSVINIIEKRMNGFKDIFRMIRTWYKVQSKKGLKDVKVNQLNLGSAPTLGAMPVDNITDTSRNAFLLNFRYKLVIMRRTMRNILRMLHLTTWTQGIWWYDTAVLSSLVSNVYFKFIIQDSLDHAMDMGIMWHWAAASDHSL